MRRKLFSIALFILTLNTAYAADRWADVCTKNKIAQLGSVNASNAQKMLAEHFSLDALGARIIGGSAKWKDQKRSTEKKAIQAQFKDAACIKKIYDELAFFKSAKILKFKQTTLASTSIVSIAAGGKKKQLTIVYDKSCKILNLCSEKSGCVDDAFRIYCRAKK